MAGRYTQLKMEFGGEEVAAESLREALKYARRAVERGDKITHPDVLMLLDLFEMEAGNAVAEEAAPTEAEMLRERLKQMDNFHLEGARRLTVRIRELEEEVRIRSNALTKRITQVASLQADLEKAEKQIEELSRKARDWEQRWNEVTDKAGAWQEEIGRLRREKLKGRNDLEDLCKAQVGELTRMRDANRQQMQLLKAQEIQLEAQAVRIDQLSREKTRLMHIISSISDRQGSNAPEDSSIVGKFGGVVADSIPFFARKNKEYGNAIESTGVRGSVVALTGDVARLRVMLKEPVLDIDNIRDKLQDVLVQAGIGIVLLDTGNVDGKGV